MNKHDPLWAERLLQRASASVEPRPEDAARNLASIEARLGIAPAASLAPGAGAASSRAASHELGHPSMTPRLPAAPRVSTAPPALSLAVKVGLLLAFGLATGVVGYLIGRAETERKRKPLALDAAPAAMTSAERPSPLPAEPESSPAFASSKQDAAQSVEVTDEHAGTDSRKRPDKARATLHAAPPPAKAQPSASKSDVFDLAQALELLRRAEAAVRRSDGLEARMWLSDLDRLAPPELLLEERLVTKTLADCALGDTAQARETLRALAASNPESIYRARLEASCVAELVQARGATNETRSSIPSEKGKGRHSK